MQDEQELNEGQKVFPLKHKLGLASGTLLSIGGIDMLAHLGPTGLLIGGIAAYVAWELGPEVIASIQREVSALAPDKAPTTLNKPVKSGKRSIPDKLLGRYPVEEEIPENISDDVYYDEECDEANKPYEPLPQPEPIARPSSGDYPARVYLRAQDRRREILLADNLGLDIDEIIDAGVFVAGMKGSGKSSLAARLMEQTGRFPLPQVIYDIKGDFVSLIESPFERGMLMTSGQEFDAATIFSRRLQIIVDLRSWDTMDERASVIAELNKSLLRYAMSLPEEYRIPWFMHLDEAQQFVSQQQPVGIEPSTWKEVTQSVTNLGVLGRAYGAVPCLYTQRIASIHKDVVSQQELRVFMKASLDNDLKRYEEYINAKVAKREDIQSFRAGDAVVLLPDGSQHIIHFLPRESKHGSHTPHLEQALRSTPMQEQRAYMPTSWGNNAYLQVVEESGMLEKPVQRIPSRLQRALEVYHPGMSYRELGSALGIGKDAAGEIIKELKQRNLIDNDEDAS